MHRWRLPPLRNKEPACVLPTHMEPVTHRELGFATPTTVRLHGIALATGLRRTDPARLPGGTIR